MIDPSVGDGTGGGGGSGGTGGGGGGYQGVGTNVFNIDHVKLDAASDLRILAYLNVSSADDLQFDGYIIVDGVVQQIGSQNLILDRTNSAGRATMTVFAYVAGLAAGTRNIIFSIANREPDSPLTVRAGSVIEVTELRNAAK